MALEQRENTEQQSFKEPAGDALQKDAPLDDRSGHSRMDNLGTSKPEDFKMASADDLLPKGDSKTEKPPKDPGKDAPQNPKVPDSFIKPQYPDGGHKIGYPG
jgi:hypothetical protein